MYYLIIQTLILKYELRKSKSIKFKIWFNK